MGNNEEKANNQSRDFNAVRREFLSSHTIDYNKKRQEEYWYRDGDNDNEIFPLHFRVPDAGQRLEHFLKKNNYIRLKEYDKIVSWLEDNKGKGLAVLGSCGLGKTVLTSDFIPDVIHSTLDRFIHVYPARDLNYPEKLEETKKKWLKVIDDVGAEPEYNDFGIRRWTFCDIVDDCDLFHKFLIFSSNLSIDQIAKRYEIRTMDRLVALCTFVQLEGESLRR